jgi:CRP/FNR family transcriptional regulator, anaerobic regulatory protein
MFMNTQAVPSLTRTANQCVSATVASDSAQCTLTEVCKLLKISSIVDDDELRFARRRVRAGQWIFGAGDKFDSVYIVYTGFVKTVLVDEAGNEQILGFPLKGDVLGIDGIHDERYASQAVALTDCELVVIPFHELATLGHGSQALENWLYKAVSRELVREHAVIGLLGTLSAEARVARFLAGLSDRFAELGYSPTDFMLRMTRQEIGSYLGLTLETVSRSFSAMDDCGLIDVNQRAIIIHDLAALRCLQKLPAGVNASKKLSASRAAKVEKIQKIQTPAEGRRTVNKRRDTSIWSGLPMAA